MDGQKASLVLHSISLLCPGQQSHLGQCEFYGVENGQTDKIILGVGFDIELVLILMLMQLVLAHSTPTIYFRFIKGVRPIQILW